MSSTTLTSTRLTAAQIREMCIEAGADDVGFVSVERPEIADQLEDIRTLLPTARTLIAFVVRMNREPIRTPARSLANMEFHETGDVVNEVGRRVVTLLERRGVRAINPPMGFPMEMDRFPGKVWMVSHKPIAVAAGLGHMGIHRMVIHPKFGNFILLGTIVTDLELASEEEGAAIDFNPCLECKLCVAACPVGAVAADGRFDFSACYTHNYREFMGGFTDWTEQIADSKTAHEYRARVNDSESASMWQSLSFGANYKAAYCMAVCPAGEDVIAPFQRDRKAFVADVVKPLQQKTETIYVLADSDAEKHVAKRFPHKQTKRVGNSLRPSHVRGFLDGMSLVFQPGRAVDLDATYHFTFIDDDVTGESEATVVIRDGTIHVRRGLHSDADVHVTADAATWIGYLRGERNMIWSVLTRRVKVKGPIALLQAFERCFPR